MSRSPVRSRSALLTRIRVASIVVLVVCALPLGTLAVLRMTTAEVAPSIHIRWQPDVSDTDRAELERAFMLASPIHTEATTFAYALLDTRSEHVRAIVEHPAVDDTHEIDRDAFVVWPSAPESRTVRWKAHELQLLRDDARRSRIVSILLILSAVSIVGIVVGRRRQG